MIAVLPDSNLLPLFAGLHLQVAVRAGLAGHGNLWVDDVSSPRCARLLVNTFNFLGGEPNHDWPAHLPASSVWVSGAAWSTCLQHAWGARLRAEHRRSMIPPALFDAAALAPSDGLGALREAVPQEVDAFRSLAETLAPVPFEQVPGVGVWLGGELIAGATAFAHHNDDAEAEIDVAELWWGRGIGRRVSAAWLTAVLHRGLKPHWDAANLASERIATRLGFHTGPQWTAHWFS